MPQSQAPTPEHIECPWCGQWTRLELVRSHYECMACRRIVLDCCDGETEE